LLDIGLINKMNYDIFNSDADGICSLHQLRLYQQVESTLVIV